MSGEKSIRAPKVCPISRMHRLRDFRFWGAIEGPNAVFRMNGPVYHVYFRKRIISRRPRRIPLLRSFGPRKQSLAFEARGEVGGITGATFTQARPEIL